MRPDEQRDLLALVEHGARGRDLHEVLVLEAVQPHQPRVERIVLGGHFLGAEVEPDRSASDAGRDGTRVATDASSAFENHRLMGPVDQPSQGEAGHARPDDSYSQRGFIRSAR
nr:hypothetical protein [Actinopolyspora erythraea]